MLIKRTAENYNSLLRRIFHLFVNNFIYAQTMQT